MTVNLASERKDLEGLEVRTSRGMDPRQDVGLLLPLHISIAKINNDSQFLYHQRLLNGPNFRNYSVHATKKRENEP